MAVDGESKKTTTCKFLSGNVTLGGATLLLFHCLQVKICHSANTAEPLIPICPIPPDSFFMYVYVDTSRFENKQRKIKISTSGDAIVTLEESASGGRVFRTTSVGPTATDYCGHQLARIMEPWNYKCTRQTDGKCLEGQRGSVH